MKLRDAARCGKASEVMIERINAAIEKLNAKERAVLAAIESLPALNTSLGEAFEKWDALLGELDDNSELNQSWPTAPHFDPDDLTDAIMGAFEDARSALSSEIGNYEEIVSLAAAYEEPEEEEEGPDAEDEVFLFDCDHPGCKAESPEEVSDALAKEAARAAGWDIDGEGDKVFCPKHRSDS
jgi:hypothetical protein